MKKTRDLKIILETDLGRDLDDFATICYLASVGVKFDTIFVSPGDPDQLAVAHFIVDYLDLGDVNLISSKLDRNNKSSGGVHYEILNKYGYPLEYTPKKCEADFDSVENYLVIGPPIALGKNINKLHGNLLMQGGFIGYDTHNTQCVRLSKFEGKKTVPSFNPNGAKKETLAILENNNIKRQFVSKNLCHTIVYDKKLHEQFKSQNNVNKSIDLIREGMNLYLKKHDFKMFHDPTAAVLFLHPEFGKWVKADMYCEKGCWGAKLNPQGDSFAIDIDRDLFWNAIFTGN